MNIHLHIERLVLEGLPVTQGQGLLVQQAVEAELARLLSTGELTPSALKDGTVPTLNAGNIQMDSTGNPSQIGQQIAQSVYGGISK